ncbi:MAG: peptidylprolyl isomerase [Bacteroidetes bacterium]|nr:peptidylprolyl isomerase [Bacteroidota bacterium]MCL2302030.1 peptidylprolyl isomerase [Lentimicrobiaceae bacterium]
MIRRFLFLILFTVSFFSAKTQTPIDAIIAWIGKDIILQSDLEKAYAEYTAQFAVQDDDGDEKCTVFEHLVYTKLMLHQADVDSIVVTDQQVEAVINMRMNYFLQMVGGDARVLERHFGKSIAEIKKDMREIVREQMYVEEVQENITTNITVTPSEVKNFVNRVGVDSMPMIPATYEFGHILRTPPVSEAEIVAIKERLEGYKERALRSDSRMEQEFSMLARLYSDDPGSASKGGNLGFVERGVLYPEFEAVAFNLRSGEISHVLKTRAGYHIILLHERRGESVNVSHILLQPKPSAEEQVRTIEFLDSVRQVILDKKMNFSEAAMLFSEDPNRLSGGWVINPYTLSTRFDQESLDQATFATISKLIPGEFSTPVIYINEDGVTSYRLLYLRSKVAPHRANLVEDYDVIKNAALEEKKNKAIERWIINKVKTTSIRIHKDYKDCEFVTRWQIN